MPKVVRLEIPVDDPDRAAGFYRDALGWDISRSGDEPYWPVRAGRGRGTRRRRRACRPRRPAPRPGPDGRGRRHRRRAAPGPPARRHGSPAEAAGTRHRLVCLRSRLRGQHDRAVPAGYERCRPVTGRPGTSFRTGGSLSVKALPSGIPAAVYGSPGQYRVRPTSARPPSHPRPPSRPSAGMAGQARRPRPSSAGEELSFGDDLDDPAGGSPLGGDEGTQSLQERMSLGGPGLMHGPCRRSRRPLGRLPPCNPLGAAGAAAIVGAGRRIPRSLQPAPAPRRP